MTIKNVYVLANGKKSDVNCDIVVENGIITAITPSEENPADAKYATAGYIDIHTHGGHGHDYFECTQEAADAVGSFHLKNGTTSYVATSVATPIAELDEQFKVIRTLENKYADMIGLHLEGPYISLDKKGAQPEQNIKTTYDAEDKWFFENNKDVLKIITVCPATGNAAEMVRDAVSAGIKVQGGHDDSVYPEIIDCVNAGLDGATHVYCAMSGLRRKPGSLVKYMGMNETALFDERIMTEIIADDMHIPEALFEFVLKNKGYKSVSLVSDSLSAAGMPEGYYMLGTVTRIYNMGKVALLENMKTLAGSVTPVSKMVQNVVSYGVPIAEAVYMGNQTPASYLGLTDRGVLEVGKRADIVIVDENGALLETYKQGVKVEL